MARCSCAGSQCMCLIVAGTGVVVTGSGHPGDPYVITAISPTAEDAGLLEYERMTPAGEPS